jgi:hypothetical protein
MTGRTLGHYRVLEKLGAYRAAELRRRGQAMSYFEIRLAVISKGVPSRVTENLI